MKYTIDQHVVNLERMLKRREPCRWCPWDKEHALIGYPGLRHGELCDMCKVFIGMIRDDRCPCFELGKTEALKRTHLALEEYHEKH